MLDEPSIPLFDDLASDVAESNRLYSERLTGDRLTAEFRAPLSSTRRNRLRPASAGASLWQDPEQISLIGEDL